jgi:hypothetical protein
MPRKILDLDTAILYAIRHMPNCQHLDKVVLQNFLQDEFAFARYNNSDSNYVLITKRAIRLFSDERETLIEYEKMIEVDLPVRRDTVARDFDRNYKTELTEHPELRVLEIKMQTGQTIFLPVSQSSSELISLERFIHQTICRYRRYRD